MIDKELLEILACPLCKTSVRLEGEKLVCSSCERRYPIREGIPVMLIEEAEGGKPS
ncbi:MAG: Trm112 family protein [Candidatus Omnitrophica bacterium]|nr:Trm112 family protein [Candidatus Omnitrophota bacterium]